MCTDLPLECQHLPFGRQAALKGCALAGAMRTSRRYSWAFGGSVSHLSLSGAWSSVWGDPVPRSAPQPHGTHLLPCLPWWFCLLQCSFPFLVFQILLLFQVRTIHPSSTSLRCFKLFMKTFSPDKTNTFPSDSLRTSFRLLGQKRGLLSLEDDELLNNLEWRVAISSTLHIMSAQLMSA